MKILKKLSAAITGLSITVTAAVSSVTPMTFTVSAAEDYENFAKALQYSMYFYDANMCGEDVDENTQFVWRGDCHTYDSMLPLNTEYTNLSAELIEKYGKYLDPDGDGYVDVSGGMHDAGDHVEFGMPEAYAASTLGWGYYEFRDSYIETQQQDHIETIIRYFNDYFIKCTYLDENGEVAAFCYQVGEGEIDHQYWNSPEIDDMKRMGFFLTPEKPQIDYLAATSASLVAGYLNFKDTDKAYAEECLKYGKALFKLAQDSIEKLGIDSDDLLSDNADGPRGFYRSSKWEDDYCWAGMWLYKATGEENYLTQALTVLDYYAAPCYVHCWNDVWTGAMCLIAEENDKDNTIIDKFLEISGKTSYEITDFWSKIKEQTDKCSKGGLGTRSPQGYFYLDVWGSARYNTAAQLAALVYDKYVNNGKPGESSEWAKGQMEYLLGNNDAGTAYVVGYNENSVKFPHHRACSGLTKCEDTDEHRYVLYGALVGGPDDSDAHNDTTADWIYNEVTIDYNAAFVGACAGLYEMFGDESMEITPDFPPEPEYSEDENGSGGNNFWVEGCFADNIQTNSEGQIGSTNLTMYVCSDSTKAYKDVSVRYYFDATGTNISNIQMRETYDQCATETEFDGVLSGPTLYKDNIYYIEVKWDGYAIANSNKKYQIQIGSWQPTWNTADDWSRKDMLEIDNGEYDGYAGEMAKAPYICVYSGDRLIGGTEPDGTTPNWSAGKGDVNMDAEITLADLTALKKYLIKKSKKLTDSAAADVNADGKINGFDAVALTRKLIELAK